MEVTVALVADRTSVSAFESFTKISSSAKIKIGLSNTWFELLICLMISAISGVTFSDFVLNISIDPLLRDIDI